MTEILHQDKLNRVLTADQVVVFSHHNHLYIGRITKLTPKMVRIRFLGHKTKLVVVKYPNDVIRLDESDVSWYLLKNS